MLRYGSVCSGIEAATCAWHPLGWRASFVSEIEPFPRAVLAHRWPEIPLHGDFTTIQAGDYQPIDLLVGGTPCQSFSVAGLRGGLDDDRGNLALEYLRLADRLRPQWLVWENVPGVLSSNDGRDFGAILGGMVELGYGVAYRVLDAQFFGVAQRRRRVFVVGHLGDWRPAAAVLFERHSLQGNSAPSRSAVEVPTRTLAGGARKRGGFSYDDIPLAAVPILDGAKGRTDKRGSRDGSALGAAGDPMFTLRRDSSHAVAFALRGRAGGAMPEIGGDVANALRTPGGGSSVPMVATTAVRRLTPRECERLQGFADDYTLIPWRKGEAPDGRRYKALGNSMAVPVMAWIGRRIEAVEAVSAEQVAA